MLTGTSERYISFLQSNINEQRKPHPPWDCMCFAHAAVWSPNDQKSCIIFAEISPASVVSVTALISNYIASLPVLDVGIMCANGPDKTSRLLILFKNVHNPMPRLEHLWLEGSLMRACAQPPRASLINLRVLQRICTQVTYH